MISKSKSIVAGLMILALNIETPALAASSQEYAATINVAGRQRMLSQKMMKELILVKLNIAPEENKKLLLATIELFETSLRDLQNGAPDKFIMAPPSGFLDNSLREFSTTWGKFYTELSRSLKGEIVQMATLNDLNILVLENMNKIVEFYVEKARSEGIKSIGGQVVNIAGRQRMLTQKVSKALFLKALGADDGQARLELKQAKTLFSLSHTALMEGNTILGVPKTTDAEIVAKLKQVDEMWNTYSQLITECFAASKITTEQITRAADLNPQILKAMNEAVTLFELKAEDSVKQAAK